MRRVLLAILVGIGLFISSSLPTPTLSSQEAVTTISVPATQPWTDTGLDLNQGDQVTITASGIIKIAGSDPGKTPAGDQGCLQSETGVAPGLTCNSLIGRIGEGTPFEVGTSLSFSVETAGRLYLGVNDDVRFFGDNSGSWTAEVEITESLPDLQPTEITFDPSTVEVGDTVFFDSGISNTGDIDTGIFNIEWFVDGQEVGAYGSHDGVPANSTVLDGNSQFSWVATEGTHTIEFVVDVDDHVEESDESNNSHSVTVTIVSGPEVNSLLAPFTNGTSFKVFSGYYNVSVGGDHDRNQLFGLDLVPDDLSDTRILAPVGGKVDYVPYQTPRSGDCLGLVIGAGNQRVHLNVCHFAGTKENPGWNVRTGDTVPRGKVLGSRNPSKNWVHLNLDDRYGKGGFTYARPVPFTEPYTLEGAQLNPNHDGNGIAVKLYEGTPFEMEFKVIPREWEGWSTTSSNIPIP